MAPTLSFTPQQEGAPPPAPQNEPVCLARITLVVLPELAAVWVGGQGSRSSEPSLWRAREAWRRGVSGRVSPSCSLQLVLGSWEGPLPYSQHGFVAELRRLAQTWGLRAGR